MTQEFETYVDTVIGYIRWKKAHTMIRFDLFGHLTDLYEGNCQKGMNHNQAVQTALQRIGSPVSIGSELDTVFRPRHAWGLFLVLAILGIYWAFFTRALKILCKSE